MVAALAALVLVAAATSAVLGYRLYRDHRVEAARTAAEAAAQTSARALLSYDYRRLDDDFARARAELTGSFAADYEKTTANVVRPTATRYKVVVKADVVSAAVVSAAPDRVVVLLFVNQTTTSTRVDGPKLDQNRVRMTMEEDGDRWKVAGVDAL